MSPELPKNSFKIIKETYLGDNYLHIIACSSYAGVCEQNTQEASKLVRSSLSRVSICFPSP